MRRTAIFVALAGSAIVASSALADVVFTCQVIAQNADTGALLGSQTWTFQVPPGSNPSTSTVSAGWGSWQFGPGNSLPGANANPMMLDSSGDSVHGVGVAFNNDPEVQLNFNLASGVSNTTFTVNSSIVSFAPIASAVGYASAFVGVTDSLLIGTPGVISLTGLEPGNSVFAAQYNSSLTSFANLIPGSTQSVSPGSSYAYTGNLGDVNNPVGVVGSVNQISSQFMFTLSAGDRASGTSTFVIVPAPGAAGLLGLGGLLASRRRRA